MQCFGQECQRPGCARIGKLLSHALWERERKREEKREKKKERKKEDDEQKKKKKERTKQKKNE